VRNNRAIIVFILLVIVIFLNLPVPASFRIKAGTKEELVPFQNVLSFILQSVEAGVVALVHGREAVRERDELLEENMRLRHINQNLTVIERENEELRKSLGFMRRSKFKMIPCKIIGRDEMSGWWRMVRVNKGYGDGIRPGMPVIAVNGLVGRVHGSVARSTCDILLITDPGCKVSCKIVRTGAPGIIRGNGISPVNRIGMELLLPNPLCTLNYIPKDENVPQVGDEVITSGLGEVFPEGIQVGRIKSVELDRSGLYWRAIVVPSVELDRLRYVFVIVQEGGESER
jgi:rod shape-determining protein MreC